MQPPKLFLRFLRWYCNPALLDRIEGDLFEVYYERVGKLGKRKADWRFIIDVIMLLRPEIVRVPGPFQLYNNGMIKNYFSVAWRNVIRNKTFSFINIGGLVTGITCSLLILLWVNDELNVDKFNSKEGLYNVYERIISEGKIDAGPWAPGLLAGELKHQVPEIKYATGVWDYGEEILFSVGDKKVQQVGIAADSDFFKMFHYDLLKGSDGDALSEPTSIAVSRKMAVTLFGTVDAAYGNVVRMRNDHDLKITAVFENVPDNASQQFDFVVNWRELLYDIPWLKVWIYRGPFTYVQLHSGADPIHVESKIKDFLIPFLTTNSNEGYRAELGMQPYGDMYLHSTFSNGLPDGGRIEYVKIFTVVAIFILLIACINFMNLSTARSVKRAKEVGIRKTMGALRTFLITQFLGEALLLTLIAASLSLVLVALVLPSFNLLTDKHIAMPWTSLTFWGGIATMSVITGLVAGMYPAFFLSSLNAIRVLKGSLKMEAGSMLFRKSLVVFQFVLVITFIAGTVTVSRQLNYMQSKSTGFDKENTLVIPFQGDLVRKYDVFKQRLLASSGISGVTRTTNAPTDINTHEYDLSWEGKSDDEKVAAIHNGIGYEFIPMMNIEVLQGRNFSKDFISDSSGFIINETALRTIGYDNPIGKPLSFIGRKGTIIGVVKDFHLTSVKDPIKPLIMFLGEHELWGNVLVRTEPGQTQQALAGIENIFREMEPEFILRYEFADIAFKKLYNSEQIVSKLSSGFSVLAIFIACLGLFGLMMFTVEQRRKEIGVRKVIGATTMSIVNMLSGDILKLVFVAALVASPLAWFAMNSWLDQFAYKVDLGWWIFVAPPLITLMVALCTTSWQAVSAGMANPVTSLRSE